MGNLENKNGLEKKGGISFISYITKYPIVQSMIAALAISACSNNPDVKHIPLTEGDSLKTKDNVTRSIEKDRDFDADIYDRFHVLEDGSVEFNLWGFLFPLQLELSKTNIENRSDTITLGYEYARLFDTANQLTPESRKKLEEYLKQELINKYGESIIYLDPSDNSKHVYELEHRDDSSSVGAAIDSIYIIGFTSPEGPVKKGSFTIAQESKIQNGVEYLGEVDKENIKLGKKRAGDILPFLKEAFGKVDSTAKMQDILKNVDLQGQEIQHLNEEIATLDSIAQSLNIHGAETMERVYELYILYNDNSPLIPTEVKTQLDEIIASKRKVNIVVNSHSGEKTTVVIPLPLFLFFLPRLWRLGRKRKADPSRNTNYNPYAEKKPHTDINDDDLWFERESLPPHTKALETEEAMDRSQENPPKIIDTVSENLPPQIEDKGQRQILIDTFGRFGTLYDETLKNIDVREFETAEEESVIDDIYQHFDDAETVENGLDYEKLALQFAALSHQNKNKDLVDILGTYKMLDAWKQHDSVKMRKAGIPEDEILRATNYFENSNQIKYAYVHAIELRKLAEQYNKNDEFETKNNFRLLLEDRVRELAGRRAVNSKKK